MGISRRGLLSGLAASGIMTLFSGCKPENVEAEGKPSFPHVSGATALGEPDRSAVFAMHLILDAVGLHRTIQLYSGRISRPGIAAFATMKNGVRYIVYDRQAVPWPTGVTPWKSVFITAHEIAHHSASHVHRSDVPDKDMELEADFFAGYALSRLGATQRQATSYYAHDAPATAYHPASALSREAARAGWQLGERMKRRERAYTKAL